MSVALRVCAAATMILMFGLKGGSCQPYINRVYVGYFLAGCDISDGRSHIIRNCMGHNHVIFLLTTV